MEVHARTHTERKKWAHYDGSEENNSGFGKRKLKDVK